MDHDTYLDLLAEQTARFARVAATAPPDAAVPSCPDWDAADLLWHLTEVQYFWARIVGGVEEPEQVPDLARPAPEYLVTVLEEQTLALLHGLRRREPAEWCWSWADDGESVGWVARRQAHEALIHRVDAELVAGTEISVPDATVAADGVDEMLAVFLDGVPAWGSFADDGRTLRIETTDTGDAWSLRFGRFTGTSPNSGAVYDEDAMSLAEDLATHDTTIRGTAWDLDLWLWGRADADALQVEGDPTLAGRLRAMAEIE